MDGIGFRLGRKLVAAVCPYALLFILQGCGEPEANSSTVGPPNPLLDHSVALPGAPELRIPINRSLFHTLDFMALSGCELQKTLGKYQSSLGRQASDSQRLLLDLEYLRLAPRCIRLQQERGETEQVAALARIEMRKREELTAAIYNATLAGAEFQHFWRKADDLYTAPGQQPPAILALRAICALAERWLAGDYRASNIGFEIYLSEIAQGGLVPDTETDGDAQQQFARLEEQLASVLPAKYRVWMAYRRHYFSRLEQSMKLD